MLNGGAQKACGSLVQEPWSFSGSFSHAVRRVQNCSDPIKMEGHEMFYCLKGGGAQKVLF